MSFFKPEDLFREFEKIEPGTIPIFSPQERVAMVLAGLSIVMPYFFAIMGGLGLIVLLIWAVL
jgi:hypothetical protein